MMVEARSALARLMNEGKMSMTGLQQAVARLEAQRSSWLEVAPSDKVRNFAAEMPEQYVSLPKTLSAFPILNNLLAERRPKFGLWTKCRCAEFRAKKRASTKFFSALT